MRPRLTRVSSREHLANPTFRTRIADPHATDAVTVTNATDSAGVVEVERMLTTRDAANALQLSESWLAKARKRGDGPPFAKMGRAIRYPERTLLWWVKSHLHQSTSER